MIYKAECGNFFMRHTDFNRIQRLREIIHNRKDQFHFHHITQKDSKTKKSMNSYDHPQLTNGQV